MCTLLLSIDVLMLGVPISNMLEQITHKLLTLFERDKMQWCVYVLASVFVKPIQFEIELEPS